MKLAAALALKLDPNCHSQEEEPSPLQSVLGGGTLNSGIC